MKAKLYTKDLDINGNTLGALMLIFIGDFQYHRETFMLNLFIF